MNPLPPPVSRRRGNDNNVGNMIFGEVASIDTISGIGRVSAADSDVHEFPLTILSTGDLLSLINAKTKTPVQISLIDGVVDSVAILRDEPSCRACDNASLVREPPVFVLKSASDAPTFPEISVVLIDTVSDILHVMRAIQNEKSAVGLEIVQHVKTFACVCVSSNVFAVDLSALRIEEAGIFLSYLIGFSKLDVPIISTHSEPFSNLSIGLEKLKRIAKLIVQRPVSGSSTLDELVKARLEYTMNPFSVDDVDDVESLAFNLGRGCFHARQIFLLPANGIAAFPKRFRTSSPPPGPSQRRRSPVHDETLSAEELNDLGEENAKKYLKWFQ